MTIFTKRLSSYSDVLCNSSFRNLLIGQSLSMAGDAICLAALPITLIRGGYGAHAFGSIMAAVGFGSILGALVGGSLADRKSPRLILMSTDITRGLAQFLAVWLLFMEAPWWCLVFSYLVFGLGIGISRPFAQVLLVHLLPKQTLVAANSALNLMDNIVAVLFPATLGVFIIIWNPLVGIFIDGLTFFGAAVFMAMLPHVSPRDVELKSSWRDMLKGVGVVFNDSRLLLGFFGTLILNVLCFPIFLVMAPFVISERFSEELWGFCLAASGLGACVGCLIIVLASAHERLMSLFIACGLILSTAMALLGMGDTAWLVILGAALIGFVEASWLTGWATAMQTYSPERDLGKVVAVDTLFTNGLHPFVYLGSGIVGGVLGYSTALSLSALVSLVCTVLIVITFVKSWSAKV